MGQELESLWVGVEDRESLWVGVEDGAVSMGGCGGWGKS